jgi:tagatose 6-phosphate kinase
MNPSVDISYPLDALKIDDVNRVEKVSKTAGGKGLNVSRVIKQMNGELIASGILGGSLGTYIVEQLNKEKVPNRFLEIEKESRNCIAILHEGNQTEILESGPTLDDGEGDEYFKLFEELLDEADVVTISGSLPKGLSSTYYQQLLEMSRDKQVKILVDTSGEALKQTLLGDQKPFLIKPNTDELNDLLEQEVTSDIEGLKEALSDSLFDGVEAIVVSMGADGAFAKIHDEFYKVSIPKIHVVNPVGSGDATIAGLAMGIDQGLSWVDVLKTAMTTGMLNTMENKTGHINIKNFETYFEQVKVEKINE